MRIPVEKWEDQYDKWIEENCQCGIQESGCTCPSFEQWFEAEKEWLAFMCEDDQENYA